MKLLMTLRIKKAAISVLKKELGWKKLISLLPKLSRRQKQGEPFSGLPEPENSKDIESRALIGEAILLYRELLLMLPSAEAERIIRKVIIESAVAQLYSIIPLIRSKDIMGMTPDLRSVKFCSIINQFPNAEWTINKVTDTEYSYLISRCRLVELIIAAGHPELKDAFCAGDGIYFERHQAEIIFDRPSLIGSGDKVCDFNFRIKDINNS